MNSYQKLKQKLEAIRADLYKVCLDPETTEAKFIINSVRMRAGICDIVWFGSPDSKTEGLINMIQNHKNNADNS